MATQGSRAGSYSPPLETLPPAQRLKWAKLRVQVLPPSQETPVSSPFEPVVDQRSCCHRPIRCAGLIGSIARYGSTFGFGEMGPGFRPPLHIGAKDYGPYTDESPA